MYNEDRKKKFQESTKRDPKYVESVFRTLEPYERKAGLDACEFQAEQLQEILNHHFGFRQRAVGTAIAFLQTYVRWCEDQGYKTEDGVFHIDVNMEDKIRRLMVASPKHLQIVLDRVFAPVESRRTDCIYRCFLWMLFSGLDETDAIDVTADEINFWEMTIEHHDKTFELYREAVPSFKMACEATEFVYWHPQYDDIIRKRFDGELLMRGIRSDRIALNTVKALIGKTFKEKGVETTLGRIRLSGIFYRAYEAERIGEKANFDDAVAERLAKLGREKNGKKTTLASRIRRDLKIDYACWKAAFSG